MGKESLDSILERVQIERERIDKAKMNKDLYLKKLRKDSSKILKLRRDVKNCDEAVRIVEAIGEQVQSKTHSVIASIVTSCLRSIFVDEAYSFRIEIQRKRNSQEARMFLEKSGQTFSVPDDCAGGELDVISFALRVAAISLSGKEKVLIMDEPFRFLSREYRQNIGEMLQSLCSKLGFQIILVTHYRELEIGKVIHLE